MLAPARIDVDNPCSYREGNPCIQEALGFALGQSEWNHEIEVIIAAAFGWRDRAFLDGFKVLPIQTYRDGSVYPFEGKRKRRVVKDSPAKRKCNFFRRVGFGGRLDKHSQRFQVHPLGKISFLKLGLPIDGVHGLNGIFDAEGTHHNKSQSTEHQRLVPAIFDRSTPDRVLPIAVDCDRMSTYAALAIVGLWAACLILIPAGGISRDRGRRYSGTGLMILGVLCALGSIPIIFYGWIGTWGLHPNPCPSRYKSQNYERFHGIIVTQKCLTFDNYCNTVIGMANVLNTDKQIAVIGALAEGSSIRSIERITGVHRDTIMRLGVKVGKGCQSLMDAKMRDLPCHYLEFDEIWGFIGKKEKHCTVDDSPELGDVWTFCAVDAETKLVPTFRCGKRDRATANAFVQDVASRMKNRVQISTDGLKAYVEAVEKSFGADVDYAQIIKTYTHDVEMNPNHRYSAPEIVTTEKKIFSGSPDISRISTSYVERLNGTTRTHMRRLTRLTLAFSKKLENFEAAVGLHFAYYNFVRRHNTLRCTPAMAAGIEQSFLSVGDLIEAAA